ncbi:hypothetical protein NQT62_08620 [Limnobacter humi]|uniref:Lipoprotein n=1 Tax=Limnobacter humi TaxID=1778671 RepID=A0ABT1WG52_9BURK|nr:hypothetical protein [Limnobacter humi]MCQ8896493.1 hypothetical protein [Limnobacter humi]
MTLLLSSCAGLQAHPQAIQLMVSKTGVLTQLISTDETAEECSTFTVDAAVAKAAIAESTLVSERAYAHDLDASNCSANGTLSWHGKTGTWTLDRTGRILLVWADGKAEYRLCKNCQAPLFAQ